MKIAILYEGLMKSEFNGDPASSIEALTESYLKSWKYPSWKLIRSKIIE